MSKGPDRFPTTQWSLVARGREGLAVLFDRYRPALLAHLRFKKRMQSVDAEDAVQGFVAMHLVEKDLLAGADQNRGKFRTYLLTALDRYVSNERRSQRAIKRGGQAGPKLDVNEYGGEAVVDEDVSSVFDVEWGRRVLDETLDRMRAEYKGSGRDDIWHVFDSRLIQPMLHGAETPAYDELVERCGLASPAQASNLLITGKRAFSKWLRAVIAEYVDNDEQIEEEIRDLITILGKPGPQS